jgi:hypothetical protein
MRPRGQGAMEYLMTYGWAILVIMMVGAAMWRLGVFSISASVPPTSTGFDAVKPILAACARYKTDCPNLMGSGEFIYGGFYCQFVNMAGSQIRLTGLRVRDMAYSTDTTHNCGYAGYVWAQKQQCNVHFGDCTYCPGWCDDCAGDFFGDGMQDCSDGCNSPWCTNQPWDTWCGPGQTGFTVPPGGTFLITSSRNQPETGLAWGWDCDTWMPASSCSVVVPEGEPYRMEIDIRYKIQVGGVTTEKHSLGVITGQRTGCPSNNPAPVSSCPFIFTNNGSAQILQGDLFNQGMLGVLNALGRRVPFPKDYHVLRSAGVASVNGSYQMAIREIADEVVYLDETKLYSVEHSPGVEVVTAGAAWTTVFDESKTNLLTLHTISKTPKSPVSCVDGSGSGCLDKILKEEYPSPPSVASERVYTDDEAFLAGQFEWNTLQLDLGNLTGEKAIKLVINGVTYWPTDDEWKNDPRAQGTWPAYIQVVGRDGGWVNASYMPVPSGYNEKYAFDVKNLFQTENYTVRLNIFAKSDIDYVAVDTTEDENLTLNAVELQKADLRRFGAGEGFLGNMTRYGKIEALLERGDDKYAIFTQGDEVILQFGRAQPPAEGKTQTLVMYNDGYFKLKKYGMERTVEPLPFHAMTNYPYDKSTENYPLDEERTAYLTTYNTRPVEPLT